MVAMGLAFDGVRGPMGVRDLIALHQHQARLEAVRDQLAAENQSLDQRVQRLKSDDHYLERLIRRELGYARSDELVYRYSDSRFSESAGERR